MTELGYGQAILLGFLQGVTEFLPISSSAHLALTQRLMGLAPDSPAMLLFDVLAHLGTLVAVSIVFAGPARRFLRRLLTELSGSRAGRPFAWRVVGLTIAATIPTAIIGLAFKDTFEEAFAKPRWIGAFLILTGFILAGTAPLARRRRGWRTFRWWHAVIVGVAQACAIFPGISRSGATICAAAYCGLRRRWTAEFSFLLAVPAIVGASLLKIKETVELPADQLALIHQAPIIVGALVSLLVGIAALKLLLSTVRRGKLHYFALYCWAVGALVLAGVV